MRRIKSYILIIAISLFMFEAEACDKDGCCSTVVVDIQKIINESLAAKTIREQLEKKNSEYQSQINKKEEELNKKSQELSKQQATLTKEAFDTKVRDFNNQVAEVQRETQVKKNALDQAYVTALGEMQKVLDEVIGKFAEEKHFCIALPTAQTLFYKKDLDITDVVLKALNDRLKKVEVKIPAINATKQ
ncbi:Outer membrane protein [Rickettsiales bacterium Ac37b]|nr:Outer membrane protein [Rickettsiales bacterium Ac37b]